MRCAAIARLGVRTRRDRRSCGSRRPAAQRRGRSPAVLGSSARASSGARTVRRRRPRDPRARSRPSALAAAVPLSSLARLALPRGRPCSMGPRRRMTTAHRAHRRVAIARRQPRGTPGLRRDPAAAAALREAWVPSGPPATNAPAVRQHRAPLCPQSPDPGAVIHPVRRDAPRSPSQQCPCHEDESVFGMSAPSREQRTAPPAGLPAGAGSRWRGVRAKISRDGLLNWIGGLAADHAVARPPS